MNIPLLLKGLCYFTCGSLALGAAALVAKVGLDDLGTADYYLNKASQPPKQPCGDCILRQVLDHAKRQEGQDQEQELKHKKKKQKCCKKEEEEAVAQQQSSE